MNDLENQKEADTVEQKPVGLVSKPVGVCFWSFPDDTPLLAGRRDRQWAPFMSKVDGLAAACG